MTARRHETGGSRRPAVRRDRRGPLLLAGAVLAVAISCGDPYQHTNPYDPAYPVAITILGPDTLFSYQEVGTYGAQVVPPFPDTAVQYAVSDSLSFPPAGPAAFRSNSPPPWPATRTITLFAEIGAFDTLSPTAATLGSSVNTTSYRHIASMQVVLTQRVVRIQLRCPDTHTCAPVPAGGTWSVWVDGFDALNQLMVSLHSSTANPATGTPVALFTVRDTTIAVSSPVGIRATTVTALRSGTTWIVAARDSLRDSLQLVVP